MLASLAIGLVVVLLLSAFFSGSETALMSVDRFRLKHLEERHPNAKRVQDVVSHPERVLGTILTGNVFVNTAAGALLTYGATIYVASEDERARTISLATVALTALILVFGEMVPKSIAARHPEAWSLFVIRPVSLLIRLGAPIVWLLSLVSNAFLSLVGEGHTGLGTALTLEEIKAILYSGGVPEEESGGRREMLHRVIELGEKRVAEVMVPRPEMVAVDKNTPLDEIVAMIQSKRFSRMPIYDGTLDNIVGLLFAKDVITYWDARVPFRLEQVARKAYFLPDTAKVEQALEQLQQQHTHLAIVVDEHGGVEGLVTLEDLLEEIVGELLDEKDEVTSQIVSLPDGSFLLDGALSVKELNETVPASVPEHPDYHTLAGYMLHRLGHIPVAGEELDSGAVVLSVDRRVGNRILRVRARRAPARRSAAEPSA